MTVGVSRRCTETGSVVRSQTWRQCVCWHVPLYYTLIGVMIYIPMGYHVLIILDEFDCCNSIGLTMDRTNLYPLMQYQSAMYTELPFPELLDDTFKFTGADVLIFAVHSSSSHQNGVISK